MQYTVKLFTLLCVLALAACQCNTTDLACKCHNWGDVFRAVRTVENVTTQVQGNMCVMVANRAVMTTIWGVPTKSPLVRPIMASFEQIPSSNNSLILFETVLLTREVSSLQTAFSSLNLLRDEPDAFPISYNEKRFIISALHNHWLFNSPETWFMHMQAIQEPMEWVTSILPALQLSFVPSSTQMMNNTATHS